MKPQVLTILRDPLSCVTCGKGGTFQIKHKIYCRLCWYDAKKEGKK